MDSKWLILKVLVRNKCNDRSDAVIGWIGHVSVHLGSLLSPNELTILCALVCRVGHFDAQIKEIVLYM